MLYDYTNILRFYIYIVLIFRFFPMKSQLTICNKQNIQPFERTVPYAHFRETSCMFK